MCLAQGPQRSDAGEAVIVLWLFLKEPWVGLLCMIVVFPEGTHLPFNKKGASNACHVLLNLLLNKRLMYYCLFFFFGQPIPNATASCSIIIFD